MFTQIIANLFRSFLAREELKSEVEYREIEKGDRKRKKTIVWCTKTEYANIFGKKVIYSTRTSKKDILDLI